METTNNTLAIYVQNMLTSTFEVIDNYLKSNSEEYTQRSDLKQVIHYVDEFFEKDTNIRFLLMPGLRGIGKTTMLYQIYDYLIKKDTSNFKNVIYISVDKLIPIKDFNLYDFVEIFLNIHHNTTLSALDKKIVLLVDEAQFFHDWALDGKRIYDTNKNIFMIFTGSSSLELEYNADVARRIFKLPVFPLNYLEHINLKYNKHIPEFSEYLLKMIFSGEVAEAQEKEFKTYDIINQTPEISSNEWNNYLKYGGFPFTFNFNKVESSKYFTRIVNDIINVDFSLIKDINLDTKKSALQLLLTLTLQKPGKLSQNTLADYLDCPVSKIKTITNLLERTQLIFHMEQYGSSAKRTRSSWKYYFATSSLRNNLAYEYGINYNSNEQYEGILLENLVASSLYNLRNKGNLFFNIYCDNKKEHADFLIQKTFENPIPLEVGKGKKKRKQLYRSMGEYKSDFGILVADNTSRIEREDDIIFIPPKTFSFL